MSMQSPPSSPIHRCRLWFACTALTIGIALVSVPAQSADPIPTDLIVAGVPNGFKPPSKPPIQKPLKNPISKPNQPTRPSTTSPLQPATAYCSGETRVSFSQFDVKGILAEGNTGLNGRGYLSVEARVRFSKRRVFVEGVMAVQEKGPPRRRPFRPYPGGRPPLLDKDTRYQGTFQRVRKLLVPPGCEIATVTPLEGSMSSLPKKGTYRVYGSGVLDEARCTTNRRHVVWCQRLQLADLIVRFRPARTTCDSLTIEIPTWTIPVETLRQGNYEMGGNQPFVRLDAELDFPRDRVGLRLRAEIEESRGDRTLMRDEARIILFDVAKDAPGCRITGVSPRTGRLRGQTRRKNDHTATVYGTADSPNDGPLASGLIQYAFCRTDTDGSDRFGRIGCGDVGLAPIRIELAPAR